MKLYYTPTSPFVRKVLLCAHERGLASRIEHVLLRPSPVSADPTLSRDNPLAKIPALVLDDGSSLYDSPVICAYLDTIGTARRMIPEHGPERWRVLRQEALCDGLLDAGVLVYYEKNFRPKELHWSSWIEGQSEKARQALDTLEREAKGFGTEVDLGQICAAAAIGWLEFRDPLGDIRAGRPSLFRWYDQFRTRPSMQSTEPHL